MGLAAGGLIVAIRNTTAKAQVNVNRPWLISPAWRYAIRTLDRLEEERRSRKEPVRHHKADK